MSFMCHEKIFKICQDTAMLKEKLYFHLSISTWPWHTIGTGEATRIIQLEKIRGMVINIGSTGGNAAKISVEEVAR